MVARESALTPPSLRYYFSDLDEIREFTIKYIHMIAQKIVVEAMTTSTEPTEMLRKYLEAHLTWAMHFRKHLCVWISFISFCSSKKHEKALNTEAVINGAHRVSELLSQGREAGVFHHQDDFLTARMIQALILGWLTTLVTENVENEKTYSQRVIQECFRIVSDS